MRVFPDLPPLTVEEAERCWLKPKAVMEVAALDHRDRTLRNWFDGAAYRGGHIPSEAGPPAPYQTRLFSLASCVATRAMWEEVQRQRPANVAAKIGSAVAAMLPEALASPTLGAFRAAEYEGAPWRVLLVRVEPGDTVLTEVIGGAEFTAANIQARDWWSCSVVFPHHLLCSAIQTYAELWGEARAREARRQAPRPDRRRRAAPLRADTASRITA